MDDSTAVEVLEGGDELEGVVLDFEFRELLPPLQQLVQCLVLADLEENVHVLVILKEMFESDNIGMT